MSSANSIQIGGDHYKSDYQHWDFCCDVALPYLVSASTKYVTRYNKKNGEQDLEKAIHYLQKNIERADSAANFQYWSSVLFSPHFPGSREPHLLMQDFLDSTFGKTEPEKPGISVERASALAREAVYLQVFPYVMLPLIATSTPSRGFGHWGEFAAFADAIRRFGQQSIHQIANLRAFVYPPQETGEATPDYVNQDR